MAPRRISILHNLLSLHYSRHESCTVAPFSDQRCRHGSHQRPSLSREEMLNAAPAEGAVIFLPFGLSRRAGDGLLVAGCADCEQLPDGDTLRLVPSPLERRPPDASLGLH